MNPSSPSAGPPPSAQHRSRSRRDERSRSRERVSPRSSSHASLQPQLVVPPSRVQQTQTLATQGTDEDSATLDPQNCVSNRSRPPQDQEDSRRHGPQKQKGKRTVAEKQPSKLPKAKKHKSINSDEDAEEPQNEPGKPLEPLNLLYQYFLIIKDKQKTLKQQLSLTTLQLKTVNLASAANSQGVAAP